MATAVDFGTQERFGFNPRMIPGCVLWLDGARPENTASTYGTVLTTWLDRSGFSNHATAVGSPAFTGSINDRYCVATGSNAPGANAFRGTAANGFFTSNVMTSFAVATAASSGNVGDRRLLSFTGTNLQDDSTSVGNVAALDRRAGQSTISTTRNNTTLVSSTIVNDVPFMTAIVFDGTNASMFFNGALTASSTAASTGTFNTFAYGAGVPAQTSSTAAWEGAIGEIVTYNRNLSRDERQQVEGYLAWEWGLQGNLPSGHPYREYPTTMRLFQPVDLPGLALWVDASDPLTITTSGGGNVTQWRDKSIQSSHFAPYLTNSNATVSSNFQNNLNVLNFTGLNMYLAPGSSARYPVDAYLVMALKSLTVQADVLSMCPTSATDNFNCLGFNEHTARRWQNGSTNFSRTPFTVPTTDETSTAFLLMNWSLANTNYLLRRNGVDLRAAANYSYTLTAGSRFQIGFRQSAGYGGPNINFGAYIGEIVIYDRQLSLSERQRVEGYLVRRWNVTSGLPSGHPFLSMPPSSPLFDPRLITGCILWLDAADKAVFTGGGATWTDKSGTANNATNGTPGTTAMPAATTWSNGLTAARFVAGNLNSMKTTNVIPAFNVTYFIVFRITALVTPAAQQWLFINNVDGQRQLETDATAFPARVRYTTRSASGFPTITNVTQNQQTMISITVPTSAGSSLAYANGSIASSATSPVLGTTGNSLHYFGSANGASGYISADIAEILIYNTVLSTTDRQRVEGYLAWKWGTQTSLPTAHPYAKFRS